MTGRRSFDDLRRSQGWRFRLRVRWLGFAWRVAARVGWCRHPATVGLAAGREGVCLYCRRTVPWDEA